MERQTKGIWIPIEIWEDKNLSWNERILLLEIDSFTTKDKDCFISNEYIANLLNVSETTANKILSSLIKKGYVIKTAFDGRRRYVKSALQLKAIQPCTLEQPCLALYDNIPNTSNNTIKEDNIIILSKKAEDNAEHVNVKSLLESNNGVKKCSKKVITLTAILITCMIYTQLNARIEEGQRVNVVRIRRKSSHC